MKVVSSECNGRPMCSRIASTSAALLTSAEATGRAEEACLPSQPQVGNHGLGRSSTIDKGGCCLELPCDGIGHSGSNDYGKHSCQHVVHVHQVLTLL